VAIIDGRKGKPAHNKANDAVEESVPSASVALPGAE